MKDGYMIFNDPTDNSWSYSYNGALDVFDVAGYTQLKTADLKLWNTFDIQTGTDFVGFDINGINSESYSNTDYNSGYLVFYAPQGGRIKDVSISIEGEPLDLCSIRGQ